MGIQGANLNSIIETGFYTKLNKQREEEKENWFLPYAKYATAPQDEFLGKQKLVTDEERALLDDAVKKTGIAPYSWTLLTNDHEAIAKSQKHLIDLIRYYEGDNNHYYETVSVSYRDIGGNKTVGFGEYIDDNNDKLLTRTQNQGYKNLVKHIEEHVVYLKNKIGKETYNSMPNSIKEALIDLSFNKGPGQIGPKIKEAIKNKNWSEVVKNLKVVSLSSGSKPEPGLYKRSLSRAILAVRDLTGNEQQEADNEIKKLYQEALQCFKANNSDTKELDKIYEQYTTGKISGEATSAESGKILVDKSFKGKGVYSVAQKAYSSLKNKGDVSFEEFYKAFKQINHNPEAIVIGAEMNVPFMKSVDKVSAAKEEVEESKEKQVNSEEKAEEKPKEEKGFFSRLWDGICNVCSKIGHYIKGLFVGDEESKSVADDASKSTFQKMLEKGTVTDEGEFKLISLDHKIVKKENLSRLARQYDTTVNIICNDNDIEDKNKVNIGQTIKIQKLGYKVEKGDNLFQISKKTGLTVEMLKDLNNIEDEDKINAGKMLEIPGFVYKVKENDSLSQIAEKVGVEKKKLKKINNLSSDAIKPGQRIIVIFNNADYAVSGSKRTVSVDEKNKTVTETIDMSACDKLATRPLLQKKMKVNGKVVATRKVYDPQKDEKNEKYKEGKLSGKTIIINAGHGYSQAGTDIGTPGLSGLDDEWLLNYDNAMKLKNKLYEQGAKVIFLQGKARLIAEEVRKSNNKADMFISVHVNSAPNTQDRTQVYYRNKDVSGAPRENSIKLANIMVKNFQKWIPKHEDIDKEDQWKNEGKVDYAQESTNDDRTGVLKAPLNGQNIPGVIWEVAFMTTEKGRERLADKSLMSNYADIITQSVIEYFN